MKLEALWLDTAQPFAQALQGPLEGRPAVHPFAAKLKATPGHFGRA